MSHDPPGEPTPEQLKRVLQEAILRNYPNPERKGCPCAPIMKEAAGQRLPFQHQHWEHISHCSPCYREFLEFRSEVLNRESRYRRTKRLTIVAAIVLIIGAGSIYLSRREPNQTSTPPTAKESTPSQPNQPSQGGSQSPLLSAVLNLESESISRSAAESPSIGEVQRIPRGRLALSIYLPTGSEAGQYDIQVLKTVFDQTPLATSSGTAAIENGLTILRIAPDLSTLAAGTYILSIRRGTGPWRYYRFVLS